MFPKKVSNGSVIDLLLYVVVVKLLLILPLLYIIIISINFINNL